MGALLQYVPGLGGIAAVPSVLRRDRVSNLVSPKILPLIFYLLSSVVPCLGSSLRVSAGAPSRLASEVEADYTTSHVFVDELANDSVSFTIFFDPQTMGVATAEVFTNLNRRDRAAMDADGDGVEDGILPPDGNKIPAGDDKNYYKAYPMQPISGGYTLTLQATKCGAYRLTARYHLNSDPVGVYHWYSSELNAQGIPKRDHAIVVTPTKARAIQLYEVDVLSIDATGTTAAQRSTFTELVNGPPAGSGPRFSLAYLKTLGLNTMWLLPIHPAGIDGRQTDPSSHQPYDVGSPYAVKNFFAAMPLMASGFKPGGTPATNDTANGRAQAMSEFRQLVQAADAQGIDVMLDAPFNHSGHDVELAAAGNQYWGGTTATAEIRAVEARFFSRVNEYDMRASSASDIALAPDRNDFGKWPDTFDIYYGRYAALVPNAGEMGNYTNEGDWFDYSVGSESSAGQGNGHFDSVTQRVWRYFGDYLQFWLTQTGYPLNAAGASLASDVGIDGLRGDFGQGLPPQCWEYIINRTRTRKWNFVFMAESLDGGPVTYRSARHFDVLNESLIYNLHHVQSTSDFRAAYDSRRSAYGAALVLLNTTSHDEDNYKNPFEALLRFAVNNAMDGVPLISAGQELGLRGTVVPPNDSNAAEGPPFGYERYFAPFDVNKMIPQFMTFNSMMPLWRALGNNQSDASSLLALYSEIANARKSSPALRSSNRVYLNLQNNTPDEQIFSVAKFERQNADPAASDVVFAFVNLQIGQNVQTPQGNAFNVDVDNDHDGMNDFGIKPDRLYNVKNIAAYAAVDPHRSDVWLWPSARPGSDLLKNGIFVSLNRVPADANRSGTNPWEPQYLKLYDVTTASPHARKPHATDSRRGSQALAGSTLQEIHLQVANCSKEIHTCSKL
jgi:glycosidase